MTEPTTHVPPPVTMTDRIRSLSPGYSILVDAPLMSVRVTVSRVKSGTGRHYTTRPEGDAVRVWRLA